MRRILVALLGCVWVIGTQAQTRAVGFALAPAASGVIGVVATWAANPPTDLVTGYRLSYGTVSGQHPTTIDAGNVLTLTVTGLSPATTYYFVLVAYNATGVSPPTPEVVVTTKPAVVDPCAFPLGTNAIQVFPTHLQSTGSGGPGSNMGLYFQVGSPNSPVTSVGVMANGVFLPPLPGTANPITGPNLGSFGAQWFVVPTGSGTYPLVIAVNNVAGCARTQSTSFAVTVP